MNVVFLATHQRQQLAHSALPRPPYLFTILMIRFDDGRPDSPLPGA